MDNRDMEFRPRPLLDALRTGAWKPAAAALLSLAVVLGIVNADQLGAWQHVLVALDVLITAGAGLWHAVHVVRRGEPLVTPLSAPQSADGVPLVARQGPDGTYGITSAG